MEEIINKFKDEFGYIKDIKNLYYELTNIVTKNEATDIIYDLLNKNIEIKKSLEKENYKIISMNKLKEKKCDLVDYVVKEEQKDNHIKEYKVDKDSIDISFYIEYIDGNYEEDNYLSLLPKINNKENLLILDSIISYYVKEINMLKYFISFNDDMEYVLELEKNNTIYNRLINYKLELLNNKEDIIEEFNDLVYYMNGDVSYIYNDIKDSPEAYESINNLLESIKNGTFKNIKYFSGNNKTKGLLEVRDLYNLTRVFFEISGENQYTIIGALTNKRETTKSYKDWLINRYSRYKNDRNSIKENCDNLVLL